MATESNGGAAYSNQMIVDPRVAMNYAFIAAFFPSHQNRFHHHEATTEQWTLDVEGSDAGEDNSHQIAELKRQLVEEQQKNTQLTEELRLEREKSTMNASTMSIQSSRASIAAQLLGIDVQLLEEPQNEWKDKFEQLNIKYVKVKRLYWNERKVAAKLLKKLKEKDRNTGSDEQSAVQFGTVGNQQPLEEQNEAVSSPVAKIQLSAKMRQRLLRHQMDFSFVRTGGVFKCPACPVDRLAYSTPQLLAKHQKTFHRDRQHWRRQCQECGRRFQTNFLLMQHMRTHTGEKPFVCTECGKGFAEKRNLKRHERVHTGERPYVCADCQKAFVTQGHLVCHSRVHSGAMPYSCRHCARPFKHASACRRHEKTSCPSRPLAVDE